MSAPVSTRTELQSVAGVKTITVRVASSPETKVALVDDQDHIRFRLFKWSLHQGRPARSAWLPDSGKRVKLFLDREVLGLGVGDPRVPRHLNGNPLDCRRINLEAVSRSLRALFNNKRATNHDDDEQDHLPPRKRSLSVTSSCPGVYPNRKRRKWVASIAYMGKRRYLGQYESEDEARRAREAALQAILHHRNVATNTHPWPHGVKQPFLVRRDDE
jgi:hypothetical protein